MMKKIVKLFCAVLLSAALTACGSGEPASAPSVADSDKAAVQEKLNKQDSKSDETKTDDKQTDESAVTVKTETDNKTSSDSKKVLVAYFSRADENYKVGTIEKGNTQIVAEYIAKQVNADSFHIQTQTPYPADYDECCDVAKKACGAKGKLVGFTTLTPADVEEIFKMCL